MRRLPYAKPLKKKKERKVALKRGPLRKVNAKRKARLFLEDFGGKEYLAFIKAKPCVLCHVEGYSEAAHVRSRGAGGKACDIVPLCGSRYGMQGCHKWFDLHGRASSRELRELLQSFAAVFWAAWESRRLAGAA